jgi:hypothetical protein
MGAPYGPALAWGVYGEDAGPPAPYDGVYWFEGGAPYDCGMYGLDDGGGRAPPGGPAGGWLACWAGDGAYRFDGGAVEWGAAL